MFENQIKYHRDARNLVMRQWPIESRQERLEVKDERVTDEIEKQPIGG